MNRFRVISCAFVPAALGLGACVAEPAPIRTTRLVTFNEGDFATARDVSALKRRVERAANAVCMSPRGAEIDLDCKTQALRDARQQIDRAIADRHLQQNHVVAAASEPTLKGEQR